MGSLAGFSERRGRRQRGYRGSAGCAYRRQARGTKRPRYRRRAGRGCSGSSGTHGAAPAALLGALGSLHRYLRQRSIATLIFIGCRLLFFIFFFPPFFFQRNRWQVVRAGPCPIAPGKGSPWHGGAAGRARCQGWASVLPVPSAKPAPAEMLWQRFRRRGRHQNPPHHRKGHISTCLAVKNDKVPDLCYVWCWLLLFLSPRDHRLLL